MLGRRVSLMHTEIILGIALVIIHHQVIPRHLGDDGGRRNRNRQAIALDDGSLGRSSEGKGDRIDEDKIRWGRQRVDRPAHREPCRLLNIHGIDLACARNADPDSHSALSNVAIESLANCLCDLLGVIEARQLASAGQDHRCGNHGASERSPPGFIDTSDKPVSALASLCFKEIGGFH